MQQRRYGEWKNRLDGILFYYEAGPAYLPTCSESIRTRYSSSFRTNLPLSSFRALIRQIQINEEKEHRRLRNLIDSTSHRRYESKPIEKISVPRTPIGYLRGNEREKSEEERKKGKEESENLVPIEEMEEEKDY